MKIPLLIMLRMSSVLPSTAHFIKGVIDSRSKLSLENCKYVCTYVCIYEYVYIYV